MVPEVDRVGVGQAVRVGVSRVGELMRPVWFLNLCALSDWTDAQDHLASLVFWVPYINRYLDETHVKGDVQAESVVRVLWRLFSRAGDFSKLRDDPHKLKTTYRRLRGLAS